MADRISWKASSIRLPDFSSRWGRLPPVRRCLGLACMAGLLLVPVPRSAGAPEEKKISIFSIVANYSLPVAQRGGRDYVGLLEILEPLGSVSAQVNGNRWKLRFNETPADFEAGKPKCLVQGREFNLGSNFGMENGRGLVPLESLGGLLPLILGGPVTLHEDSRRLYIGSVAVHFTAQMSGSTPPSLVMNFTSPVNPRIATEPGKVRMLFSREPLVPPSSLTLTFDSKTIPSAIYEEENGAAQITINTHVPLFASFSDNGRTIILSPPPQEHAAEQKPVPQEIAPENPPPVLAESGQPPLQPPPPPPVPVPGQVFAVLDASHGGDERGAALSDQQAEKDLTLDLARKLRQQFLAKGISAVVLRDGDITLSVEQRAVIVNRARPKIYIVLHGTTIGRGARIYTALVPPGEPGAGAFLNWDTAQLSSLALSRSVAAAMADQLRSERLAVKVLAAPLRPLNNIAAPAVAIEIVPVNDPSYDETLFKGLATAVVTMRKQLEGGS